jgi:hypothetical protein
MAIFTRQKNAFDWSFQAHCLERTQTFETSKNHKVVVTVNKNSQHGTYSKSSLKISLDCDTNVLLCWSLTLSVLTTLSLRISASTRLEFKLFDLASVKLTAMMQYWSLINMSTIGCVNISEHISRPFIENNVNRYETLKQIK